LGNNPRRACFPPVCRPELRQLGYFGPSTLGTLVACAVAVNSRSIFRVSAPTLLVVLIVSAFTTGGAEHPFAASEGAGRTQTDRSPVTIQLVKQAPEAGYVGEERCRACHKAELTEFHKTGHARVSSEVSGQQMNCESCHGAGRAHSDAEEAARGEDAATLAANKLVFAFRGTARENSARCLTCHTSARGQQDFAHSRHAAADIPCQSCHATHLVEAGKRSAVSAPPLPQAHFYQVPRPAAEERWLRESLLKDSQPGVCYPCHAQVRGQFAQAFHHRVPEGSMKCTDCHNAHGTRNQALLVSPGWETCTTCHLDKHGPFLFEHAAVRVEGCAICHSPHGAVSRFMLKRRESRFLCLQCHGDPHAAGDQVSVPHSRLGFQTRGDCTRCHVAIHGSNFSRVFLQ